MIKRRCEGRVPPKHHLALRDEHGQLLYEECLSRDGFEGPYTAITTGLQIKPWKSVMFRPEIRYDYNGYSRPFEGKHDLLTAALDMLIRY